MKKRLVFIVIALLGTIALASAFAKFSSDYVRRNLRTLHFASGTSLSRTIIEGASSVFEIQRTTEEELLSKLIGISNYFSQLDDISQIKQLEYLGFALVVLTDLDGTVIYETEISDTEVLRWREELSDLMLPLLDGETKEAIFGINLDFPGYKFPKGIAIKRNGRILTVFADTRNIAQIQTGLGHLIRNIASESGINYVVLQNEYGIVMASRGVSRVSRYSTDRFIQNVVERDETRGRFTKYNGQRIYEVVSVFPEMGHFYGVLRVGLSLREYEAVLLAISVPLGIIFFLLLVSIAFILYNVVITRKLKKAEILTSGIKHKFGALYIEAEPNGKLSILNDTAKSVVSDIDTEIKNLCEIIGDKKWEKLKASKDTKIISDIKLGERYLSIISERLDPDDKNSAFYLMGFDTTELYDLKKRAENLHHLEGLSELTATIAHDIRNPLNAISIAAQKLDMLVIDDKQRSLLDTMNHEIQNLNKMVEEFLSLSAPLSLRKEKVNLSDFLSRLYEFAEIMANDVEIAACDQFDNRQAYLDRDKISRAIGNILKNAIEASPKAGIVKLTGKIVDNNISISIINTGTRIPDDVLDKLFKPIASRKNTGYGLGLFSSYRIVRTHQGEIDVRTDDSGTEFVVLLPLEE